MFTYIGNDNGSDATRSSTASSLTLQQHLSHHYRALAAARPIVDTGQRRRPKLAQDERRRRRRAADHNHPPSGRESADDRRLVEAILGDDQRPPQHYCRQQDLDTSAAGDEICRSRGTSNGPSTAAVPSILGKIDCYLNQLHATKVVKPVKRDRAARHDVSARPWIGPHWSPSAVPARRPPCHWSPPAVPARRPPCHWSPPAVPARSMASNKRQVLTSDVIERFPQDFTAKRPFRPQVVRTSASPRLRYMRVYRGPVAIPCKSRSPSRGRRSANSLGSSTASATSGSSGHQSQHRHPLESTEDYQDSDTTHTEDDHMSSHRDEEDRDKDVEDNYGDDFEEDEAGDVEQESSGAVSSRVPPLAISPDSDHGVWLTDQASKVLTRRRTANAAGKTNHRSPSKDSAYNGGFSSCSRGPTPEETAGNRPVAKGPTVAPPAPTPPVDRPAHSFGEDQAYLQFLNEVTSDILARGVFTNRILKRVMAAHVDRHRGKLDTARMRSELERLRFQLGIPDDDALDDANHGFGCVGDDDADSRLTVAQTAGRPTLPSPLEPEPHSPTFIDSLLFPSGERREEGGRCAGPADSSVPAALSGGQIAASSGGRTVALPADRQPPEGVVALLASLSLDESVTQTILDCCQKQTHTASIASKESKERLNWRIPQPDFT